MKLTEFQQLFTALRAETGHPIETIVSAERTILQSPIFMLQIDSNDVVSLAVVSAVVIKFRHTSSHDTIRRAIEHYRTL